jgi:hypothetical protein
LRDGLVESDRRVERRRDTRAELRAEAASQEPLALLPGA